MPRDFVFSHLSSDQFDRQLKRKAGRKGPRHRDAVSCWPCRTRKTRCDRKLPCTQCANRGALSECAYEGSGVSSDASSGAAQHGNTPGISSGNTPLREPPPQPPLPPAQRANHHEALPNTPLGTPDSPSTCSASSTPTRSAASLPSLRPNVTNGRTCSPETRDGTASETSSRIVGITHWMAPCSEMLVVNALMNGSDGFEANRRAFEELKKLVKEANEILPGLGPTFSTNCCPRTLLPDRSSCEAWFARYCQTWGRIYAILDPARLVEDLDAIFPVAPEGIVDDSLPLLRIFLVVAIAMQESETHRLLGRRLARYVEDCIHSSAQFRKPCLDVMQLLLLLTIIKVISASDTDDMSNMLGIQGLASQIVLVLGLHRDPSTLPPNPGVSPYDAELRRRLWACFLRLSLDYCIRSGTQFVLFVDNVDCPLPSSAGLPAPRQNFSAAAAPAQVPEAWLARGQGEELDGHFDFFAAKLARIILPLQQDLCANNRPSTRTRLAGLQADARRAFDDFLAELPLELRAGFPTSCPVRRLQQTLLSTTLHSFALVAGMSAVMGRPYDISLQGQLTEVWDHSISILDQFQAVCQGGDDGPSAPSVQVMAHQLLWADVARAALCSCLAVGKMHRRSLANLISAPMQQQTAAIFEQVLSRSLSFLVEFWKGKFYLGPVTSKLALLLAVAMTVTANLRQVSQDASANGVDNDDAFKRMGLTVAEEWVNGMRQAVLQQKRQAQGLTAGTNPDDAFGSTSSLTRSSSSNGSPATIQTSHVEDTAPMRGIRVLSGDVSPATGFAMDGEFLHAVPMTGMHALDSLVGDEFDAVDFDTAGPKLAPEFSFLDSLDFGSDVMQDSLRDIFAGLDMVPAS